MCLCLVLTQQAAGLGSCRCIVMLLQNSCYDKRRLFPDNSLNPTKGSWDRVQVMSPSNSSVTAETHQLQTCSAWPNYNHRLCMVIVEEFDGLTTGTSFRLPCSRL